MVVRSPALRRALAAILLVVLTLSGVGRGLAVTGMATGFADGLAGVTVVICHSGAADPAPPAPPNRHECCDACALCAPAFLPEAAPFTTPARVEHYADHAEALVWAPAVTRVPTPRLSQGPPDA